MDVPELHPDLEPIAFLVGVWEGAGVGGYPTIESFNFGQEIVFGHNGKPFLTYTSRTWLLDEAGDKVRPLGTETGFWRQLPGRQLEVCLSHPTGIVEIYVGEVVFHKIELHTDVVARTATAKEYTARPPSLRPGQRQPDVGVRHGGRGPAAPVPHLGRAQAGR